MERSGDERALGCECGDNRCAIWMARMDRTLVERARQGDHAAFAILAESATDRLYGVATLILRDPDRAQDAVQEALVSAWRDVRGLRDPDAWNAWIIDSSSERVIERPIDTVGGDSSSTRSIRPRRRSAMRRQTLPTAMRSSAASDG